MVESLTPAASSDVLHLVIGGAAGLQGLYSDLHAAALPALWHGPVDAVDGLLPALRERAPQGGFRSLHLYSHAAEGRLDLGGATLTAADLPDQAAAFEALGALMAPGGDLLIHGCSAGAGAAGRALLEGIAQLSGVDVAGSDNPSGDPDRRSDQDWRLERHSGRIEADAADLLDALDWPGRLEITPEPLLTSASWIDADGDRVEVHLEGPVISGSGFRLTLAGGAADQADATRLELVNTTDQQALRVQVTPERQPDAGSAPEGLYNRLYSPGTTSIGTIAQAGDSSGTGLESLHLSGAIVQEIHLPTVAIGTLVLDAGRSAFVDRINNSTLAELNVSAPINTVTNTNNAAAAEFEVFDESPTGPSGSGYLPVAGQVDLGDVSAASIDRLLINGVIGEDDHDPGDNGRTTNDLRGTIEVSGGIGRIDAPRGLLSGEVRAAWIHKVTVGRIVGAISSRDPSQPMTLSLPGVFQGFVNAAGHLNLGYDLDSGIVTQDTPQQELQQRKTGEITAGGGISGTAAVLDDPILFPNHYRAVLRNTSSSIGIADLRFNGLADSRWFSASDIGSIRADGFRPGAIFEAAGDIGDIEASLYAEAPPPDPANPPDPPVVVQLEGFFQAGGNIGNLKSATGILADVRAGGDIGDITALTAGIDSQLIEAGGSIGRLWAHNQALNSGKIVALNGGIAGLTVGRGSWGSSLRTVNGSIGPVRIEKGKLEEVSFVADRSIERLTVRGTGAISGGSFIAGASIGPVRVSASRGPAITGALFQAGDEHGQYIDALGVLQPARIDSIQATAYGSTTLPAVEPGLELPDPGTAHAIADSQFLAGSIGSVKARSHTATGLIGSLFHAQAGDLSRITGIGSANGLENVTLVSDGGSIGTIQGLSQVQGHGISTSRFNANDGGIGLVEGRGGVAGGHGLFSTYLQASDLLGSIRASSNANNGDAMREVTAHAGLFGALQAVVRGGEGGAPAEPLASGIVDSSFTGYTRPDATASAEPQALGLETIDVQVRSVNGEGIVNSTFSLRRGLGSLDVRTFNGSAIRDSQFSSSRGDIASIRSVAEGGGSAIVGSSFQADNGSIGLPLEDGSPAITVVASGRSPTIHGVETTEFLASADIGLMEVISSGGSAILNGTLRADASYTNRGSILGVKAVARGQNLVATTGISGSEFEAARIGDIRVDVTDFDGGTAISGSSFIARTATEEPVEINGRQRLAFNNQGRIGNVVVRNGSRIGNGIEASAFIAGAAGQIGDVRIDMLWGDKRDSQIPLFNRQASGVALYSSLIRASAVDPDQVVFNGTIGTISISAGRVIPEAVTPIPIPLPQPLPAGPPFISPPPNDQSTDWPAGIFNSYLAAYGGINAVEINSVGTGIANAVILPNDDTLNILIQRNLAVAKIAPAGVIRSLRVAGRGLFARDIDRTTTILGPVL